MEYKNYICIDGRKAELTEEQLKALGIELKKPSPFERVVNRNANEFYSYYFINSAGLLEDSDDRSFCNGNVLDELRYRVANYCTDKSIMEQRALHETLNRLLWRYSMNHDGDKIDWKSGNKIYTVFYNHNINKVDCDYAYVIQHNGAVHFYTKEIAKAAIEEVVKPFMEAHPEFKW